MPLPTPNSNESREDFLDRCIADPKSVEEYPDSKQRIAVCSSIYSRRTSLESNSDRVSKTVEKSLEKKLEDHREKVGSDPKKKTTLRKLKIVYNRGIGAYKSNPSSVRPTVRSPEQWAQARVNSFLYALRNLRYRSGKHDTDLLPKAHPMSGDDKKKKADSHRRYPDGEAIPSELPDKYRKSRKDGPTKGQACINCTHLKETEEHRYYCHKFKAPVRPQYWCAAWKENKKALQQTYNDYPESASNNAKRALKYKEENPDNKCGTLVGWKRANQLAKREKISRDTIARMASFKRHQQHKDVPYDEGCGGLMWDAWGGASGIEWAITKLAQIDKAKTNSMSSNKFAFGVFGITESQVDKESGTMTSVSLISVGPALGHGLFVDSKSLETIEDELEGTKLPAYITHRGALFEDRLTREIGMFDNFRIEGERLLGDFQAFDSFREDDSRKYNRLFEMAEKMPERFGLSIVFSADSVWSTSEGDVSTEEKPENALFEYPSIRVEEVSSADFVDSPAANERGLFDKIDNIITRKMTKAELIELTESLEAEKVSLQEQANQASVDKLDAEAELEGAKSSYEEKETELEALQAELEEKQKEIEDLKAKLAEHEEEMAKKDEAISKHEDEIAEKEEDPEDHKEEEEKMKAASAELSSKVLKLEKLIEGSDLIEGSTSEDLYEPSKANRAKIISEFAKEEGITEFAATLRLGKERPELFKL